MSPQHVFLSVDHMEMLHNAIYYAKDSLGNYVVVGKRHPIAFRISKDVGLSSGILPPYGIQIGNMVFWIDDDVTKEYLRRHDDREHARAVQ